jgi:hypothetical protein
MKATNSSFAPPIVSCGVLPSCIPSPSRKR